MENRKADNIPEKRFLQKLLETRVSDHYARNIYIWFSLKIAVRWSYCYIKYFTNTLANLFENAYSVGAGQGFRPDRIAPVVSFSRIFVIH